MLFFSCLISIHFLLPFFLPTLPLLHQSIDLSFTSFSLPFFNLLYLFLLSPLSSIHPSHLQLLPSIHSFSPSQILLFYPCIFHVTHFYLHSLISLNLFLLGRLTAVDLSLDVLIHLAWKERYLLHLQHDYHDYHCLR